MRSVYRNFDLRFARSDADYRVEVRDAPAGEALGRFVPPLGDDELAEQLGFLRPGGSPARNLVMAAPTQAAPRSALETATALGTRLYGALFNGDVGMCFQRSIDQTLLRGERLRVRLRMDETPELSRQPWEYLYDTDRSQFLGLSDISVVRYPDRADPVAPLAVTPPLRIAVMIAAPVDAPALDGETEWQELSRALRELTASGRVELVRFGASLSDLVPKLRECAPHVLHFIGHGSFDTTGGGQLVLEAAGGRMQSVSAQEFGALLVGSNSVRAVVLNACDTAASDRFDPAAGAAQRLVKMGVPAAVAMQFEITDPSAIAFTQQFYAALAASYPLDSAMSEGRKAIFALTRGHEWGTPVMYVRASDTWLLDVAQPSESEQLEHRVEALDARARASHLAERWADEIAALESLLQAAPARPDVAERLNAARRLQEAATFYEKGLEHFHAGRLRETLDCMNRVNELAPGDTRFRVALFIASAKDRLSAALSPPSSDRDTRADDPLRSHYSRIAQRLSEGRLVVVLGDEVNLCGRPTDSFWGPGESGFLPSMEELARHLARDVDYPGSLDRSLVTVSQFFATIDSPAALRDAVRKFFDADFPPTALHHILARLPGAFRERGSPARYPVLVTTNYDDGLERALIAAGEPFDLLTYNGGHPDSRDNSGPEGSFVHRTPDGQVHQIEVANEYGALEFGPEQRFVVLKVHGAIDRADPDNNSYVIAEDDYIDYATGRDIRSLIPPTLLKRLRKSHLLFVGYSPRVWSLRVFFRRIWPEDRFDQVSAWAVGQKRDTLDERFWRKRGVDVLDVSLESFVVGMEAEVHSSSVASDRT
jgi:hypothetical protein